jgi:hypothetical protein
MVGAQLRTPPPLQTPGGKARTIAIIDDDPYQL